MAFKPATFQIPASLPPTIITIRNFKGINQAVANTEIDMSESPDMMNMMLDQVGALDQRFGYARVWNSAIGSGQVYGMWQFKKQDGTKINLVHVGNQLFTWTPSTQTAIYTGLATVPSKFFTFGNFCYIMDGTNYLRTDGTTVVDVSTVAYVPTLTLGRAPTGGGTANENFNLLGSGFKDSFTANGSATAYQLSLTSLDATAVTAIVNGVAKVETTDFTVNRTTGVVTFAVAPASGAANNVVITAYKTPTGYQNRVKQCTGFSIYGGTNDTRIFWFGNANYPNALRRSGLLDPTYAPELAFQNVGSDAGAVKGMLKHYGNAIVFKEPTPNDTTAWLLSYAVDGSGNVSFPMAPLNSAVGLTASSSVQVIENLPTFLTQRGVYQFQGTNVSDERDVVRISDAVNPSLLYEANVGNAISVDFDKKYIIGINGNCYVYDYRQQVWYPWNNIPASCFLEIDGYLYFGSNTTGLIYKMLKATDANCYSDDGSATNAYWKSKLLSFDDETHLKTIPKVFYTLKPNSRASADLYFVTDKDTSGLITTTRVDLFDYTLWDYSNFTYALSGFPQEGVGKIKAKKVTYLQIILKQPRNNECMGILSVSFQVQQGRLQK